MVRYHGVLSSHAKLRSEVVPKHQTHCSVGCYCESEARCHRGVLRALLGERGAKIV